MLKNYFKIAWRNLKRNSTYSFIHLLGLSLALTTCLFLGAFVINEYLYDKFHEKGEHIYRLNVDLHIPGQELQLALAAGVMAPELQKDFPEVVSYGRLAQPWSDMVVSTGGRSFFEKKVLYADSTFFNIFNFKLQSGNPDNVLKQANQAVLAQRMAIKYFGDTDPIGKTLTIDNEEFTVSGIAENPPEHSHLDFDCLLSYKSWVKKHPAAESNWNWTSSPTYLLLADHADPQLLNQQLDGWIKSKNGNNQETKLKLHLQPFEEIHFAETRLGELAPVSSYAKLILLAAIGMLIFFMAIFNYINLSTALYARRTKEIGIRKTFGAEKTQIILQFLAESILLVAFSLLLTFSLLHFAMSWLNSLIDQQLNFDFVSLPVKIALTVFLLLGIGTLAGIYPAFMVSRWKPVQLFKGAQKNVTKGISFKKSLIGIQFFISIGLIIITFVISIQYQYLTEKDLGFEKEHKLVIRFGGAQHLATSLESLKRELSGLPEVTGVAYSSHVPSEPTHGVYTEVTDRKGEQKSAELDLTLIDAAYLDLYGMDIIAGRNFSPEMASDTAGALIVNETAVKHLGFPSPESIIGQAFSQWDKKGKIIGVIRDYQHYSLHGSLSPMTFQMNSDLFEKITIDFVAANLPAFLRKLENRWLEINAQTPFQYSFLDDRVNQQYLAEKRFSRVFSSFSMLALFISVLGLYGMMAITVTRRKKEIGIRKVLGAEIENILLLLSGHYIKLIIIALVVVSPLAWYLADQWLAGFANNINIPWWVFPVAGLIVVVVALLTISLQSIRIATANPIQAIREE